MAKIVDMRGYEIVHRAGGAVAIANGTLESIPSRGKHLIREKWTWLPEGEFEVHSDGTLSIPEDVARKKGLLR